jgi:hypothetical protein
MDLDAPASREPFQTCPGQTISFFLGAPLGLCLGEAEVSQSFEQHGMVGPEPWQPQCVGCPPWAPWAGVDPTA